ncbi:hypothetical protein R3P38DRAFT_3212822 [Favolaschia claudopus]|uniref:Uncharacterized protein n=1 Tax=Favolaschia claudopus TaxID=2862362 RepID=A0AAW0ADA6_9AGAR
MVGFRTSRARDPNERTTERMNVVYCDREVEVGLRIQFKLSLAGSLSSKHTGDVPEAHSSSSRAFRPAPSSVDHVLPPTAFPALPLPLAIQWLHRKLANIYFVTPSSASRTSARTFFHRPPSTASYSAPLDILPSPTKVTGRNGAAVNDRWELEASYEHQGENDAELGERSLSVLGSDSPNDSHAVYPLILDTSSWTATNGASSTSFAAPRPIRIPIAPRVAHVPASTPAIVPSESSTTPVTLPPLSLESYRAPITSQSQIPGYARRGLEIMACLHPFHRVQKHRHRRYPPSTLDEHHMIFPFWMVFDKTPPLDVL